MRSATRNRGVTGVSTLEGEWLPGEHPGCSRAAAFRGRLTRQKAAFVHISWNSQIKPGFEDGVLSTDSPCPKVLRKEKERTKE